MYKRSRSYGKIPVELMSLKNKTKFILFLIILVGAFLRVYNFPNRYSLGEETVRDGVIGIEAARELQLPLTGAFSSLGPFTFGPLYAYQLAVATLILQTVYAPWIYFTIISIAYIFVMYKVGEKLLGKNFGLLVAFLCAISPTQIISATHLTSHNNTNIFAALALWLFLILLENKKTNKWNFLLGIVIGTGMNLHYQMVGLLVLPIILSLKQKKLNPLIFSILGVITTFAPILIFELNNHWFNTRNIIHFFLYDRQRIYVPNRWLFYVRDFWPGFWGDALGVPVKLAQFIMLGVTIAFVFTWKAKKLSKQFLFLIIAFLINFVLLRYYFGQRFYGYLNFVRPFVFIFTSYLLFFLWNKKNYLFKAISAVLLISLIILPFERIKSGLQSDPYSATAYKLFDSLKKNIPDKNFAIYACPVPGYIANYNSNLLTASFVAQAKYIKGRPEIPIGLLNSKCKISDDDKKYPLIKSPFADAIDFSNTSADTIKKEGWKEMTFKDIYEGYARWWFKIQP